MNNTELKKISDKITTYLSLVNDKELIFDFLRDLLSENEIIEFSRRFEVAKLLSEKISYTEIEQKTGMSSTTIARIAKFLNGENKGYKTAIDKLKSVYAKHHESHKS
jgi:TrpR-related protein YerC/YecD